MTENSKTPKEGNLNEGQVGAPVEPSRLLECQPPPAMPAGWTAELPEQIKATLKEHKKHIIVTTILGSSFLAAALGIVGDYYLIPYKAKQEHQLKINELTEQLRLGNENKELEQKRLAYEDLDKQLEQLTDKLNSYLATCQFVQKNPKAKGLRAFASSSWDLLTNHLGEVRKAIHNCQNLNPNDKETVDSTNSITGRLGVNLFSDEVNKDKAKNPELINAQEELLDGIKKVREGMRKKKDALVLRGQPK